MAEVLSQSQIDALLSAVRSGEKDVNAQGEEQQEKKYRKYDFSSPRKFTRDRIKMLNGIFDNYSRIINSRLNARLRANCEITVESIEEQRYYEFSNALTEGDVLALIDVAVKGKHEDTPAMLYLSTTTALSMMDRMLGGDGAMDESIASDYSYTDLELRLYEELVRDMISVMGGSWENYIPIAFSYNRTDINPTLSQIIGLDEIVIIVDMKMRDMISVMGGSWENYIPIAFSYNRTDINPTLSQIIGLDEIVIIVDMKMQFSNISGRMSICLPGEILTNIFAEMSRENPVRRAAVESKSNEIFDSLRDSRLEIVSVLGETQLSLSDIYHLNVGDVIDLGRSKESSIYLDIGGYHWFAGRMGTHKKNIAVRIDEVLDQAEQKE